MANKTHLSQIALLAVAFAVGAAGAAESDLVRLEKLIRIPSVSSNIVEVNRAVDFLDGELGRDGLYRQIETMPDGRRVLFAANESTKRPDILLSAHLDVVPEKDPSQFVPRRENGRMRVRLQGACGPLRAADAGTERAGLHRRDLRFGRGNRRDVHGIHARQRVWRGEDGHRP